MKHVTCLLAARSSVVGLAVPARAEGPGPAKVIRIVREEIKPARGAAHARAEEAYVRAGVASKMPAYWVGMSTLTGPSEAWFLSSYESYEALEKENDAFNPAMAKMLEAADDGDAQFRTGTRVYHAELNADLSYRMRPSVQDMRYITVTTVRVKPGYQREFIEVRKALTAAHTKANVDEHWAFYNVTSGAPSGTYLILFGSSTLKDEDTDPHTAAYRDAVGDEGRAKAEAFNRAGIQMVDTLTLEISPQMSHVPAAWITARPNFWKLPAMKTTMAAPKTRPCSRRRQRSRRRPPQGGGARPAASPVPPARPYCRAHCAPSLDDTGGMAVPRRRSRSSRSLVCSASSPSMRPLDAARPERTRGSRTRRRRTPPRSRDASRRGSSCSATISW